MILRRSTEKVSAMTATNGISLGRTHHGKRNPGIAGGRLDHRLPRFQRPGSFGILDDADRQAILDRGERIEELALHVHRDVLGCEAVDADDGGLPDRAENAVVDHDAPFYADGGGSGKDRRGICRDRIVMIA